MRVLAFRYDEFGDFKPELSLESNYIQPSEVIIDDF